MNLKLSIETNTETTCKLIVAKGREGRRFNNYNDLTTYSVSYLNMEPCLYGWREDYQLKT